jgi:3-deoxy-D-manno-octulosonate 8-phosphate phosphatase (KDO 8-P phosphatase)
MTKPKVNLNDIRLLVMDVDGVLTNGSLIVHSDGSESKCFCTLDGHGIRMWQRTGNTAAILSGRQSEPTAQRAKQLDIQHVFQNAHYKLPVLRELIDQLGLSPNQVAYIGDDLPDMPAMRYAGFAIAVANAVDEVKDCADYITSRTGGCGAVREAIEYILKTTGKWDELMKRYLP